MSGSSISATTAPMPASRRAAPGHAPSHARRPRRPRLRHLALGAIAATSVVTGLFSLRYALPRAPLLPPLPNVVSHRAMLGLHAVAGATALIAGPWQFMPGLRQTRPGLHRKFGWIYLVAVALGAGGALRLVPTVAEGAVASAGFATLAILWIVAAGMALTRILQGRVADHRIWMIRCFAMTFGAVTLRVILPVATMAGMPFPAAYRMASWMAWVPNLLVVEAARLHAASRSRARA